MNGVHDHDKTGSLRSIDPDICVLVDLNDVQAIQKSWKPSTEDERLFYGFSLPEYRRFSRTENSEAETVLGLPSESKKPTDSEFLKLLSKQLYEGCGDPFCDAPSCYSYRKNHSDRPPRKLTLLTAQAMAITWAEELRDPRAELCPRLVGPGTMHVPTHLLCEDDSSTKVDSKSFFQALFNTNAIHEFMRNQPSSFDKRTASKISAHPERLRSKFREMWSGSTVMHRNSTPAKLLALMDALHKKQMEGGEDFEWIDSFNMELEELNDGYLEPTHLANSYLEMDDDYISLLQYPSLFTLRSQVINFRALCYSRMTRVYDEARINWRMVLHTKVFFPGVQNENLQRAASGFLTINVQR